MDAAVRRSAKTASSSRPLARSGRRTVPMAVTFCSAPATRRSVNSCVPLGRSFMRSASLAPRTTGFAPRGQGPGHAGQFMARRIFEAPRVVAGQRLGRVLRLVGKELDAEQADGLAVEIDEGGAAHDQRPGLGQAGQVGVIQPVGQVGGDAGRAVDDEDVREDGERD